MLMRFMHLIKQFHFSCFSVFRDPELELMSERVIVAQRQFANLSAISWRKQDKFQWDDDEVRFVLDQHAGLDFCSASSLKQQSAGRHVAPLGHTILIASQH